MTERKMPAATAALLAWHALRFAGSHLDLDMVNEFYRTGQVVDYTGSVRALRELSNYKLCQELLYHALGQDALADAWLIREAHRALMDGLTPPGAEHTAALNLLAADIDESDALRGAAVFLLRFQVLHPFRDGNERTAWMLMNYRLALRELPPIPLRAEAGPRLTECLERQEPDTLAQFLREQAAQPEAPAHPEHIQEGGQMAYEL